MIIGRPNSEGLLALALLAGFGLAVGLRMLVGGPGVAQSAPAGLAFAVCLVALGLTVRPPLTISPRALITGLAAGLALCGPALLAHITRPSLAPTIAGFWPWSITVTIVAAAEEYFLRGALFNSINIWLGPSAAVITAAIAFALLHVPLYGPHVLSLDLAVGLWLGALRLYARSWTAPAVAHILADLASWWLR